MAKGRFLTNYTLNIIKRQPGPMRVCLFKNVTAW